ncbi:MAG: glycosyltransferase [Bacteroidales bacterium]|jgi:sugar transferase (PEP-CTERM/EpsH1 system associated)|nr:glycosyltransferase [Bacteroidales bacterium]
MKILVVLSRVPYPLEKGDKLRAFHQLRMLSKKHEIYLFALNTGHLQSHAKEVLSAFCKEIRIFHLSWLSVFFNSISFFLRGLPLQCGYFYNARAKKELSQWLQQMQVDHIYAQLIRTAEYVKDYKISKTLDYQDVMSKGVNRLAQRATFLKKIFLKMEHKRVQRYEHDIFPFFDNKTIITHIDRDLLPHPQSHKIVVVPNGVDTERFMPSNHQREYDLIFTGNMSYQPNIVACEYIVNEILPPLKSRFKNIKIALCGANPSKRVLSLRSDNVYVTGWVEDIREYYARSAIFIAPMQLGTGLQNKLLEAMAMRLPCITSPLAGTPIGATPNEEIIICNSILGYIDAIEMLMTNEEVYKKIAYAGYLFVHQHYNWENTTQILEKLIVES